MLNKGKEMNYSIKVININSEEKITEINGSGKIAVHSADKVQILANESGIFSFFSGKSQNTENLIAIRNGKNLEIILENGDVFNFYKLLQLRKCNQYRVC